MFADRKLLRPPAAAGAAGEAGREPAAGDGAAGGRPAAQRGGAAGGPPHPQLQHAQQNEERTGGAA